MDNKSLFLLFVSTVLFSILSLLFEVFPQFILFLVITIILTFIFFVFYRFSLKLYIGTVTVILLISTALFWNQTYELMDIVAYIFPILGSLVVIIVYSDEIEKYGLVFGSLPLILNGKFDESLDDLDKVLKSSPKDYFALYYKAFALNMLGKHYEALKLVNQIPEKKFMKVVELPKLNLKFQALLQLKRYDEAEELIDLLLEKDSKNEYTLYNRSYLLYKQGFKDDSIKSFEDSLQIFNKKLLNFRKSIINRIRLPKDLRNMMLAELLMGKVIIHQRLYQYTEALECCNEALKLNPEYNFALYIKGYILSKLGQFEEALKCVDKSFESFPENAYALDAKGCILYGLGKPEQALKCYQKAIGIDPFIEEAYYHKGKVHEEIGQFKDALICYNKVIEFNPYCERAKEDKKNLDRVLANK